MAARQTASDAAPLESRGRDPHASSSERASAPALDTRPPACSHCASDRIVRWGTAHGLPRYRCHACRRTFNILTNTPLAHLRNRERWLTYVGTMLEGRSIRGSAAACAVSPATSSRWRHRFRGCTAEQRSKLFAAIVAAYSNSSAELIGSAENMNSANLAWCKDLLPVVMSWLA